MGIKNGLTKFLRINLKLLHKNYFNQYDISHICLNSHSIKL